jgi:hypothetical protein
MHFAMTQAFLRTFSPTASFEPLAGNSQSLYSIYLEIAKRDHACRIAALYGKHQPPAGHTPFRPLPFEHFEARLRSASLMSGGEDIFRRQLARQAHVYGVMPVSSNKRQAA